MIVAITGKGFRWSELDRILGQRGPTPGPTGDQSGTTAYAQNGDSGTTYGNHEQPPLIGPPSPAPLSPPLIPPSRVSDTTHVGGDEKNGPVREPKLPFDRTLLDARYAILRAVWKHVEPIIGRSTTWANWRARNSTIAASLAAGGFTPEQIAKAWELASKDIGEPVRELSRIQRFLERVEVAVAMRKGRR